MLNRGVLPSHLLPGFPGASELRSGTRLLSGGGVVGAAGTVAGDVSHCVW